MKAASISKTEKITTFPKLMKCNLDNSVVLFAGPNEGCVVRRGEGERISEPIGYYSEFWNMEHFTDYTGEDAMPND